MGGGYKTRCSGLGALQLIQLGLVSFAILDLGRDEGSTGRVFHKLLDPMSYLFLIFAAEPLPLDVPAGEPIRLGMVFKRAGRKEAALVLGFGPFVGEQRLSEPLELPASYDV